MSLYINILTYAGSLRKNINNILQRGNDLIIASSFRIFEEAVELAVSDKQHYSWHTVLLLMSTIEENDNS